MKKKMRIPGPEELNEPPEKLLSYFIFIFGEKGIGKTSLISQFPGAVVGMLEPGRRNLRIRQVDITAGWETVEAFVDAAIEDATVQTIGLDTADRLYESALDYVCDSKGIDHPGTIKDFGATWREIKDTFEGLLTKIHNSGKGLVLTSHAKWRDLELRNGAVQPILSPTLSDSPLTTIKAMADYAFYYGYYGGGRRALFLRGHEDLWCACGSADRFLDPEGNPIKTMLLGESPAEAFESLDKGFGNQMLDADDALRQELGDDVDTDDLSQKKTTIPYRKKKKKEKDAG